MSPIPVSREIRDMIWAELMPWKTPDPILQARLTCRQMNEELCDMLYNFRGWTLKLRPNCRYTSGNRPDEGFKPFCKVEMQHPKWGQYRLPNLKPGGRDWRNRPSWKHLRHLPFSRISAIIVELRDKRNWVFCWTLGPDQAALCDSSKMAVTFLNQVVLQTTRREQLEYEGQQQSRKLEVIMTNPGWGVWTWITERAIPLNPLRLFAGLKHDFAMTLPIWIDEIMLGAGPLPGTSTVHMKTREMRAHRQGPESAPCEENCVCTLGDEKYLYQADLTCREIYNENQLGAIEEGQPA